ncbi:MAG TPA: LysR family transcriptional regulator [Opitutaceae bacterium]|nr:LysR family transcriptional regulator [Opitutaceae bacterium]
MAFDTRLLGGLSAMTAVVEAGSFVRAGEALGLTQSGVSRAIQRLEQQLKVRLFERSNRAVTLTDEGRSFYEAIGPLLAQLEEAAEATARSAVSVRGRLRINADAYFARLVLAPQIGSFLDAHPELAVEINVRDELGDLVADGFDIAVRFGEPKTSSMIARKLADLRVITCASPKYLAQRGTPKHPRDLERAEHACILFRDPATGRPFAWDFHQGRKVVPVAVKGRLVVNNSAAYLAACNAGLGVVQIFEWGLTKPHEIAPLVQILADWADERWPLYAYHVSRHHPPAKVKAFMDFVVALVRREWPR